MTATTITKRSVAIATGVLTSTGTIMNDGDTVTIGDKIYTFKTTLTPTEGQVLIAASATNGLSNLVSAINHVGTPDTDYKCAAVNAQVSAVKTSANVVTITVKDAGTLAVAVSSSATTLSWGTTTAVTTQPGDVVVVGSISDVTFGQPAQQVTVGYLNATNSWSRAMRLSSDAFFCLRAGASAVALLQSLWAAIAAKLEPSLTISIATQPVATAAVSGGGVHATFTVVARSETTLSYAWYESADGYAWGSALTTTGNYNVATAGSLIILTESTALNGKYYKCILTNTDTSLSTSSAVLTVT